MIYNFLKKIPLFSELPEEDLKSLCEMVNVVQLKAGETLFLEGSPGDYAYVIREGEFEVLKSSERRDVLLAVRAAGEVIGEMALLEDTPRTASVRARTDGALLAISKTQLDHLMEGGPSAARALFYTMLRRWREMHAALQQSEKMAELGRLTAGVAHELNNPAAATSRSASQLQESLLRLRSAQAGVMALELDEPQRSALQALVEQARERASAPASLDVITRSDREAQMEDWLEQHGVSNAWELAPTLVSCDWNAEAQAQLSEGLDARALQAVLQWIGVSCDVENLLVEIREASSQISEIVQALKSYAYLDQAPVQNVDIQAGLENTLLILKHKLKQGIQVKREYQENLPHIQGYGSELNQAWTNLIDNAVDALNGKGEIVLRTRREDNWVVVEIEDNGPGIPAEIQGRVFEPFFTTKPPGQGTGLGLDITYNIVVHKHGGEIKLFSQPGKTVFQVSLPIRAALRG